jgi:hypothetical protein
MSLLSHNVGVVATWSEEEGPIRQREYFAGNNAVFIVVMCLK